MPEDLLKFGLIPEFVGRLPVTVTLSALNARRADAGPDRAAQRGHAPVPEVPAAGQGRAGLHAAARSRRPPSWHWPRKTGARALRSIVEESLLDVMYDIPERTDVRKCIITEETIREGRAPLLLTKAEVDRGVDETNYEELLLERGA